MTQISRLKSAEITNGNIIDADDLEAEFDQIISESNAQDLRLDDIESNAMTISGAKTFTTDIIVNGIDERTANNGVDVDGVTCIDGRVNIALTGATVSSVDTGADTVTTTAAHGLTDAQAIKFTTTNTLPSPLSTSTTYYADVQSSTVIKVYTDSGLTSLVNLTTSGTGTHSIASDPGSPSDGDLWYNTADNELKVQVNGSTETVTTSAVGWPKDYIHGPRPQYISSTQVRIPAGFRCRDDADSVNIDVTSNITIDITTSTGAGVVDALMNGLTESNSQFYYIWVITKNAGADPAGLLTTSSSTIATYPTDYTKKRLIGVVRNDSSGNFIPFLHTVDGWVYYTTAFDAQGTANPTQVLAGGTATTYTDIDLSAFVPPVAEGMGLIHIHSNAISSYGQIRTDGDTNVHSWGFFGGVNESCQIQMPVTGQTLEYDKNGGSGNVYVDVEGYQITEFD